MTIIHMLYHQLEELPSSNSSNLQKWKKKAAFALFNESKLVKSIVHFDTTGRSSINGEWPSLILKFSDGIEYRLRPIFFAFEDREQITNLFVETFGRLAATLTVSHNQILQPKTLWRKLMLL